MSLGFGGIAVRNVNNTTRFLLIRIYGTVRDLGIREFQTLNCFTELQGDEIEQDACSGVYSACQAKKWHKWTFMYNCSGRGNMKWLTRDLTKEFLLTASPPPPHPINTAKLHNLRGPSNQGNLGKLYIIKAYGSQNLKIFRTLTDSKCLILSVKVELGQLA